MKRFHLIEFEDELWFPKTIRNYLTDFLQFVAHIFDFYRGIIPILVESIKQSPNNKVIDLASGGGGPWLKIIEHVKGEFPDLKITLSDFYPNIDAFQSMQNKSGGKISYDPEPVNALHVDKKLIGLRTLFLSFHHFQPNDAIQILQNAVDNNMPIAIFEGQERNVEHLIKFMFSPINVLLVTPFIRPFKLGRLIFTYLIPIVPILVLWDGIVSVLRTYNIKEMNEMISKLKGAENYEWKVDKNVHRKISILYLLGYPKN